MSSNGSDLRVDNSAPNAEANPPQDTKKSKNKQIDAPKTLGKKRIVRIAIYIIIALSIVAAAVFLYQWYKSEFASIKIGDTSISKNQINKNKNDMSSFIEANKDLGFESEDLNQVAKDDLILNAGLKKYNDETCKVEVTVKDLYNVWESTETSDEAMTEYLESVYRRDGDFQKIRTENDAYKAKMSDCALSQKKIFRIYAVYNSPYFRDLSDSDRKAAYNVVKTRLKNEFEPLFKRGASSSEIAALTDIDWISETFKEGYDPGPESGLLPFMDKPVVISTLDSFGDDLGNSFMTYNDVMSDYPEELGEVISINNAAKSLTKKGEHTEILTGQNGEFTIMRLEDSGPGRFFGWGEFLQKVKSENKTDLALSSVNIFGEAYADTMSSYTQTADRTGINDKKVCRYSGNNSNGKMQQDCWTKDDFSIQAYGSCDANGVKNGSEGILSMFHNVAISYAVKSGTTYFAGATVSSQQRTDRLCRFYTSDKSVNYRSTSVVDGNVFSAWHCFGGNPTVSMSLPSGYEFDGSYNFNGLGHAGTNGTMPGATTVKVKSKTPPNNWITSSESAIKISDVNETQDDFFGANGVGNPVKVYPGQFINFKHAIRVGDGTAPTTGWKVQTWGSYEWNDNRGIPAATKRNVQVGNFSGSGLVMRMIDVKNLPNAGGGTKGYTVYKTDNTGGTIGVSYEDIGRTICQELSYDKSAHNVGTKTQPAVCAKVEPRPWQLSLNTEIKSTATKYNAYRSGDINAVPGDILNWRHTAANKSPFIAPGYPGIRGYNSLGYNLDYFANSKPTNGVAQTSKHWVSDTTGSLNGDIASGKNYSFEANKEAYQGFANIPFNWSYYRNSKPPTQYNVMSDDTGKSFCQRAYAGRVKDSGAETWSDWRCAYVAYDYALIPCVSTPSAPCGGQDIPVQPGETLTPTPGINKERPGPTKETNWKVTTWEIGGANEGKKTPSNPIDNKTADSCATYNGAYQGVVKGCVNNITGKGSYNQGENKLTNVINQFTVPDDAELGKRYCFALSINPYSFSSDESAAAQAAKANDWRHSAPLCILVTKKPKMQIWGGNIYSGAVNASGTSIQTSRSTVKGNTFGSWVEYAALARGTIKGFTSGSNTTTSRLTMANKATPGKYGNKVANDIASQLLARYDTGATATATAKCAASGANANVEVCRKTGSSYSWTFGETMKRPGQPGKTVIMSARNQDVYIHKDTFANMGVTITKPKDVQQFIVIAKNIFIHPDVTNIDAWLLADNDITTCAEPVGGEVLKANTSFVTAASCGKPLKINGPVKAKKLNSWRTSGADIASPGTPAEIYNLRADAYLWSAANSSSDGRFVTTYSRELAPRF